MGMYEFFCKDCLKVFTRNIVRKKSHLNQAEAVVNYVPKCRCGSTNCRRHFSSGRVEFNDAKMKFDRMYPYVSSTLPLNMPGCRHNEMGKAVIENKSHEDRIAKEYGYTRV